MKRITSLVFLLSGVFFGLVPQASAHLINASSVLRVVTEGAYPPFSEIDSQGNLIGFDVEIAQALCKQMKRECNLSAHSWDGIIPALLSRKYDMVVASMSITPERSKRITFSDPYYENGIVLLALDSNNSKDDWEKEKQAVGVQRATIQAQYLEKKMSQQFSEIRYYNTNADVLLELQSGRIQFIMAEYLTALAFQKRNPDIKIVSDVLDTGVRIGIAVRPENTALLKAINEALYALRQQGIFQSISMRYFDRDIFPKQSIQKSD